MVGEYGERKIVSKRYYHWRDTQGVGQDPGIKEEAALLTSWLNTLLEDYEDRIYPIDLKVSENWGNIQGAAEKKGRPMASFDGLIAAVAYTHNIVLVTRNESDFEASGIPIFNPWGFDSR